MNSARRVTGRHPARAFLLWKAKRFLNDTPTVRSAASVIVAANAAIVLLAALAMRVFDAKDFPNFGRSLWWAVQTVTTVGYGDVTPQTVAGRIIAAVVMLQGVAFLAVVTATITSAFVARAQREYGGQAERWRHLEQRFDELDQRVDALSGSPQSHDAGASAPRLDPDEDALREGLT
jgi:voltage-gated potassium channel Kch